MNEASPEKPRRRVVGRTAAATAAVFAATLLAYPGGSATAQTPVDCAALGGNPAPVRIGPALDIAKTCGIEVRVHGSASHHATMSVTPDGQLHLVSTAEPVQMYGDLGIPDAELADYSGSLSLPGSGWSVFLQHTDQSYPMIETPTATLDWAEEPPVPTYSGATAVYDELAPGLDLSVDVGLSTLGLEFTAADDAAWSALSTGLRAKGVYGAPVEAVDNSLRIDHGDGFYVEWSTPFIVRDAEGETYPAHVTIDGDGAVMAELLDETLAEAVFPLTLTTQWANRSDEVNEWGSVTSALPDLPLYRGEAGLDEPYFAAAGQNADTVAGGYCDALASAPCAQAEAVAYWHFDATINSMRDPSAGHVFDYPVTSAVFTVDAAEGADCVAPDLDFTGEYSTAVDWNDRPAVLGSAASGSCGEGAAVYDLTGPIGEAWGDAETAAPITLGTAATEQTARFDGGSARLDVYFDIVGFDTNEWCSRYPDSPDFYSHQVDGGLYVEAWRDDVLDLDLTWTAKAQDRATGATVLTTEPAAVPTGGATVGAIAGLPQGSYEIEYTLASGTGDFTHTASPCYVVVDTATPTPEIEVEPGPHRIGDTVSIEVSLGTEDFAAEFDSVDVWLQNSTSLDPIDSERLTAAGTAVLEAKLTGPLTHWWVQAEDRAGHESITGTSVSATLDFHDYNGDRREDLIAVRKSDGALMFYAGTGDGTFASGVAKGTGWGGMEVVMAGDLTADGRADLLARDTKTGTLYTYPGNGSGGVGTRITVGSGWNAMGAFTSGGDFNADGDIDLYAVGKADGVLYFYDGQGNGSGKFNPRTAVGGGWNVMDVITAVGDLNDDGKADLLARDSRTGQYYLYKGDGTGNLGSRVAIAANLDGTGTDRYSQIIAVGDADGDGKEDLVAVDSRTGELELHSLNGNGTAVHAGKVIATGWGAIRLAAVNEERAYDYSGDGKTDVLARRGSDGKLYFYSGNGTGGFGPIGSWGTDLKQFSLIETAGDFNGDGFSDVIGRDATGVLYLFPGKGNGTYDYAARKQISTGWNSMSAIVSGSDYNGDGKVDVIAREQSTGYLWLYSGKGDGTIGSRVKIGSGWNGMREITAVGDLDHDGHADIIAIRSSDNCMYFYGGRGDGTLKAGVETSCNWVGYDQVAAVGDFNGDGHADWIARRKSDGAVYLYKGDGAGGYSSRSLIVSGWTWANAIA